MASAQNLFTLNRGAAVDRCDLALHFQHPVSSRARYLDPCFALNRSSHAA